MGDADHEGDDRVEPEALANDFFCECRGSLGTVHRPCLELLVRSQTMSHCRTCGGAYMWETVAAPGTPEEPRTTGARALFVLRAFVPRFFSHIAVTLAAAAVKFFAVPLLVGFYHHELRSEWNEEAAASDTLLTTFVVGTSVCSMGRAVARMHRKHRAFFKNEDDTADPAPPQVPDASRRAHDQLWWLALRARAAICPLASRTFAARCASDLVGGLAVVYLWFRVNIVFAAVAVFAASVALRLAHPPRRYRNRRQRKEEIEAVRNELSQFEVHKYFLTFCLDCVFFSVVMRVLAGFAFHYAAAPYFCELPAEFFWPTPESALAHWLIGFVIENFMVVVERTLMAPLFALGCDLIILRSVQFDEEHDQYNFVFQQLFEVDPLRAFGDAARIYITEIPALVLWVHLP